MTADEVSLLTQNEWLSIITYTRCSAKIQEDLALLKEAILLVQLNKFESGSGTISFFLGEFVPLIQTAFAVLLLDRHGCGTDCEGPMEWEWDFFQSPLQIQKFCCQTHDKIRIT